MVAGAVGCARRPSQGPEDLYRIARQSYEQGDLSASIAQAQSNEGGHDLYWQWKFRLLEAVATLQQGAYDKVLTLLAPALPPPLAGGDLEVEQRMLRAISEARSAQPQEASRELARANEISSRTHSRLQAELFNIAGLVAIENGQRSVGDALFHQSLDLARKQQDRFLLSRVLLNLSLSALRRDRWDESLDWSSASAEVARSIHAELILEKDLGNVGIAYMKLGDPERALANFQQAEVQAAKLSATMDRFRSLHFVGLAQYQLHRWKDAQASYERALSLAQSVNSLDDVLDTNTDLAFLLLERGELALAKDKCEQALQIAAKLEDKSAMQEPVFVQALLSAKAGDRTNAQSLMSRLEQDPSDSPSLRWEVEDELGKLNDNSGETAAAERWFQKSIHTFEEQRSEIEKEESQLAFFGNASKVYGDYAEYLVHHGRSDEALRLVDLGRARTLLDGLGITKNQSRSMLGDKLDPRIVARRLKGTILTYWLGPNESYLWAATPTQVSLFKLPNDSEVSELVTRYQDSVQRSSDFLSLDTESGRKLYATLVAPAQAMIPKGSKVYVIPDGSLNKLNFETLPRPDPEVRYWIEDAVIVNASSIRMLAAFADHAKAKTPGGLLLIGDPISPDANFQALPNASREATAVEKHFPADQRVAFTREQAVPAAYTRSHPERYSYIHFVAHGTASSLSPLESAVILSRTPGDPDKFKLYARDIKGQPLRAELVTIAACYGSGSRAYAGEGLVGLTWAFLRAGSHYVAGALWEVNDSSTPQLMDQMYASLQKGIAPDEAMREAKLAMLHSPGAFRKPRYWGSFQMYAGS